MSHLGHPRGPNGSFYFPQNKRAIWAIPWPKWLILFFEKGNGKLCYTTTDNIILPQSCFGNATVSNNRDSCPIISISRSKRCFNTTQTKTLNSSLQTVAQDSFQKLITSPNSICNDVRFDDYKVIRSKKPPNYISNANISDILCNLNTSTSDLTSHQNTGWIHIKCIILIIAVTWDQMNYKLNTVGFTYNASAIIVLKGASTKPIVNVHAVQTT